MLLKRICYLLLLFVATAVNAQTYDIQLTVSTQNTDCYTDGKIFVKLGGTDLKQLQASDQLSFNVQKNGISYKQHDLTFADMRADSVFVLEGYPAGKYVIDYSIWIGTNTEIKGTIPEFELFANEYLEPAVFQTLGDNTMMQGTRPSLNCKPTGRIQLEIVQGKFPYSVQVFKDGTLLRTDVFNTRMFSGSNPLAEDYRDFYNIEQLGIGAYTFIITDSCGYQLTLAEPIPVEDVNFNCIPEYATLASKSQTQVFFDLESGFFNNVKYDKYSSQWLEYRFALEGKAFTEWKSFSESDMATVANFDSIYGKKYQFELRIKDCPSYPVCLAEIQMPDKDTIPEQPCTEAISPSVMLIPIPGTGGADFCACDGGTKNPIEYDKWQVKTNFTICEPYTLPVTYKWTNLEYPQYSYSNTGINASQWSYESIQYTLAEEHYGNQIHFELTDASGKVYLDTILLIPPKPQLPQPTPPIPLKWTMSNSISNSVACSGVPLGTVFLNVNCANIPDSAEVEFSQTPNGYNFTAKYNLATREWLFNPSSFTDFTITQSTYDPSLCKSSIGLVFNELLRYGSYKYIIKWRTNSGKDTTTTVQQTIANNFGRYMVSEELSFTTKKTCQGTIYYPKAQVLSWIYGDEENKKAVPTKFRVISGNVTGYEINGGLSTVGFCNSDSLLITKPGRYIVQAFYNPYGANAPNATLAACTVSLDTINYVIQTLSFQDYYGYLCADTHTSTIRGSVTVIAKEGSGVPPYRYDLYSGSNAEGQLIGSNTTGVFNDITVTSANFYVRVEDQCLSSFGVAIPLSPVITTDAVFGDRSVCKGSVAHLQGKMIGTTNQVSYLWTGSNGFSSTNRQIVTPPIVVPSTFSLEISGLGCRIFDSITVEPVDKINVYYEDLLCQGSNYDGGEEYLHPITTAHLATGIYNFSAGPFPASNGGCDSIVNLKLNIIEENTVFEDTMVICDSQFPFLWQDTLFTEGTPSGRYFMPKQKNNCAYRQALRLTVKHPTDTIIEKIICQGERVVFNNKTYTEAGTYSEHFSTGTTCDSLVTMHLLVVFPSQSTVIDSIFKGESYTYNGFNLPEQTILGIKYETLFLKNYLGCDSIVNLQLKVQPFSLRIPELFSPNGDNKNEFFEIENIERYPNNKVLIFNRWGNKVWEKGPYLNDWDGTNQFGLSVGGNILPIGTYFYIIDLGDGSDAIKGYIYLSR